MTFQATEAVDGFKDAGGDPAYHHLAVAPALDVPLHRTGATDETLCSIARAQWSTQRRRQTKTDDRQRFIESFTQTFGGAGMIGLELARQALPLPFGAPLLQAAVQVRTLVGPSKMVAQPSSCGVG